MQMPLKKQKVCTVYAGQMRCERNQKYSQRFGDRESGFNSLKNESANRAERLGFLYFTKETNRFDRLLVLPARHFATSYVKAKVFGPCEEMRVQIEHINDVILNVVRVRHLCMKKSDLRM